MLDRTDLNRIRRESIQDKPRYPAEGMPAGGDIFFFSDRDALLPPWGTQARELALRSLYRHPLNWLLQSAVAGLIKKVKSAPWNITGARRVLYYQELLRQADFGAGWDVFLSKVLLDYLRQDKGAFIEVVAPGSSDKPLRTAATGLAYLDSIACTLTGDPEFPVVYQSRNGLLHALHYTRVIRLVDMPDGDQRRPGYGLSALSRATAIVYQSIYANAYTIQKLDDNPPPGIVIASNINSAKREQALAAYTTEQSTSERPVWGKTLWMYSVDPAQPAKLDYTTFSQAPEGWDFEKYTQVQVNAIALALGVDVQELWQLTGGALGSAGQSEILHAKSQGRMFGDLLKMIERRINDVLPLSLEFTFERNDPYDQQQHADTASKWAAFITSIGDVATADEKRAILAANIPAFAEATLDPSGRLITRTDADAQPVVEEDMSADDSTETPTTEPTQTPTVSMVEAADETAKARAGLKAIQATRLDFEGDFNDLLAGARDDDLTRRRFGLVLRDLIRKYGREAYLDGLSDGGVDAERKLEGDDLKAYQDILMKQSSYVTNIGAQLYRGGGVSDAEADLKADLWFNKSISPFYDAGRLSADGNGMYEFAGDDGAESCTDCQRLKGQRHRMKDWARKQLRPRVDTAQFDCGGWMCRHILAKTTERARGSW